MLQWKMSQPPAFYLSCVNAYIDYIIRSITYVSAMPFYFIDCAEDLVSEMQFKTRFNGIRTYKLVVNEFVASFRGPATRILFCENRFKICHV